MMQIKHFLLGLSLFLLAGCTDQSYENAKHQRAQIAVNSKDGDPIVIGIPWKSADSDLFINGVKLAVKEINQKGGLLNSPLQIIINANESSFNDPSLSVGERQNIILNTANSFAANPYLTAVVGHSSSNISLPASVIYQNNGVLFLATGSRYSKLTGHNFDYTFRTITTNTEAGSQLADYAAQLGYKNIAILFNREDSSTEFADTFATASINKYAANIVYRRSFFDNTLDAISLIIDLKNLQKLDAIFIAANSQISAKFYQQSRNMGIKLPFIGGESLDTKVFLDQVKQWENIKDIQKSSISTVFNKLTPTSRQFIQQFKQEYGENSRPDSSAALGYDSINLLAHAIQHAQSRVPIEIAVALRYMEACKGVAGKYEFKPNGDLKSRPLYFKHLNGEHFVYEQVKGITANDEANLETCNDIDHDHDTIPNYMDACPNTTQEEIAKGVILDGAKKGCPIDTDEDGVADYKDNCLNNTSTEIAKGIDSQGCPKDGSVNNKDADGR